MIRIRATTGTGAGISAPSQGPAGALSVGVVSSQAGLPAPFENCTFINEAGEIHHRPVTGIMPIWPCAPVPGSSLLCKHFAQFHLAAVYQAQNAWMFATEIIQRMATNSDLGPGAPTLIGRHPRAKAGDLRLQNSAPVSSGPQDLASSTWLDTLVAVDCEERRGFQSV